MKHASIEILRLCPNNCKHCSSDSGQNTNDYIIPLDIIKNVFANKISSSELNNIFKNLKTKHLKVLEYIYEIKNNVKILSGLEYDIFSNI